MEQDIRKELDGIGKSLNRIANSITPTGAMPARDAEGGHVESLTEAVMGMTGALSRIADNIQALADAVRESRGR